MPRCRAKTSRSGSHTYVDFEPRYKSAYLGSALLGLDGFSAATPPRSATPEFGPAFSSKRVPVVIQRHKLREVLDENGVSTDLLSQPTNGLIIHVSQQHQPLYYLEGRGRHRLLAAKTFLTLKDRWWAVDFYAAEAMFDDVLTFVDEHTDLSLPLNDGTIYLKIRHFQDHGNRAAARKWLARLSPSKRRDLRQLEHHRLSRPIYKSLTKLIPFSGLWSAFEIGTLHRILPLKCPEEIVNYLEGIYEFWYNVVGVSQAGIVDTHTVEQTQGRCPFYSLADREFLVAEMDNGTLFPALRDSVKRDQTKEKLLQTRRIIPSLRTFLEDTKWLESCHRVLRLVVPKSKQTLRQTLLSCWYRQTGDEHVEQVAENDFRVVQLGSTSFWCSYVELFCFALREFPSLTELSPRQEQKRTISTSSYNRNSTEALYRLCALARRLGFASPRIDSLLATKESKAVASDVLTKARPQRLYNFPEGCLSSSVDSISQTIRQAHSAALTTRTPEFVSDVYQKFELRLRCGRIFERSFRSNRDYMFRPVIYSNSPCESRRDITSFLVIANTFQAFFGSQIEVQRDDDYPTDFGDQSSGIDEEETANDSTDGFGQPEHNTQVREESEFIELTPSRSASVPQTARHQSFRTQLGSERAAEQHVTIQWDKEAEGSTKSQSDIDQAATGPSVTQSETLARLQPDVYLSDSSPRTPDQQSPALQSFRGAIMHTGIIGEDRPLPSSTYRQSVSTLFGEPNKSTESRQPYLNRGEKSNTVDQATKTLARENPQTALLQKRQAIRLPSTTVLGPRLLLPLGLEAAGLSSTHRDPDFMEDDHVHGTDPNVSLTTFRTITERATSPSATNDRRSREGSSIDVEGVSAASGSRHFDGALMGYSVGGRTDGVNRRGLSRTRSRSPLRKGNDRSAKEYRRRSAKEYRRRRDSDSARNEDHISEESPRQNPRTVDGTASDRVTAAYTNTQLANTSIQHPADEGMQRKPRAWKRKFNWNGTKSIPFTTRLYDENRIVLVFERVHMNHEKIWHSEIQQRLQRDLCACFVTLEHLEGKATCSVDFIRYTEDGTKQAVQLICVMIREECSFCLPATEKYKSVTSQKLLLGLNGIGRLEKPVLVIPKGSIYNTEMAPFESNILHDRLDLPHYSQDSTPPGWMIGGIMVTEVPLNETESDSGDERPRVRARLDWH